MRGYRYQIRRTVLETLDAPFRDRSAGVLIHDAADRDPIASILMRYRHENGRGWADIIDFLTMYHDARR